LEAERDLLAVRTAELETKVKTLETEKTRLEAKLEGQSTDAQRRAKALKETREVLGLAEGAALVAILHTSMGDVRCKLWPDVAPVTVRNFVQLSEGTREWSDPKTREKRTDPLYSGTVFHRVIQGFMVQGGDPTGTGRGGPGYRFEDETTPEVVFDRPGLLAMANSGPNTNGSQFFITDSTPRHLDGKHTIFGECDLGVVQEILSQPKHPEMRGQPSRPIDPVRLDRVEILRR
jgi:peptidyl-prolyl cis-trans isomerase A (cyclophilin A)